jgi:uncharacterized protein (UPF0333 family)
MKIEKKKGQASLEFIVAMSVILVLFVFLLSIALNIATGYMVHYATYKSSRSFLTYDNGQEGAALLGEAKNKAASVFASVGLEQYGIRNGELRFNVMGDNTPIYEFVGVYYQYRPPFRGIGHLRLQKNFELLSESFLGKEVTRVDCRCQILKSMGLSCGATDFDITLFDDGC